MNFRSTIIGIAASVILIAVLGVARLFTTKIIVPDLTVREIETVTFQPPPPPPIEEPPPDAPPPPPALTEVSALPDPTRVPIPQAHVPMDFTAPVENFFTDAAPAPLPVDPEPVRPTVKPVTTQPKITTPPVAKTHYDQNELDGTPRLLRHGSATFPASLAKQGVKSGAVTFEVELSTTGSVTIRKVISSTHPELIAPARKVASSARFTPPVRNGQAVKAIMRWPIVIEK